MSSRASLLVRAAVAGLVAFAAVSAQPTAALGERWVTFEGDSITLSWQTLAAMASVSSVVTVAGMAYLRAYFGKQLADNKYEIREGVRSDVKEIVREALTPLERRVERLEDGEK